MARLKTIAGAAAMLLALVACGQARPVASAASPAPTATAPPTAPATAPPPPPSPTLPAVPDFQVVAYQGDQAFGGHQGHFSAAFAAGKPVVLLYFAGL